MKKLFRKLFLMLFILCFIFSSLPQTSMAAENKPNEADQKYLDDNKMDNVASNKLMTLYANKTTGEFAVEDNRNQFIWYSNPKGRDNDKLAQGVVKMDLSSQLNTMYTDYTSDQMKVKNNFTGSIKKNSVKFEKIDNGFKVTYEFPGEDGFSIPLIITLGDTYLNAQVDTAHLVETKNTIYSIDLLPYFGAGSKSDNGYIFVPDGSGALINFNNNKANVETYSESIYGKDLTFASNQNPVKRENIKLPVFGIKNGDNAFLAVVDKGESQGTINANVSGIKSSYNNVFTTFAIRKFDSFNVGQSGMNMTTTRLYEKGKTKINGCGIKYYLLQGKDADYSGMAKSYRDYLTNEKGLKANSDVKPQVYLDLYGAVRKEKSILGLPFNVVQPLTTYKDAINILDKLKKSNVNNIVVNYHDCFSDSVDSKIPLSAGTIGKLGGSKGFKELLTYSKDNNVKLYPQVDLVDFSNGTLNYTKYSSQSKTIGETPAAVFDYRLSTYFKNPDKASYSLMTPKNISKIMDEFKKSYKNYNAAGIGLDTISSLLYSDFSKKHMSTRQQTESEFVDVLKNMKKEFGTVEASAPNAYALPYVDYVLDAPSDSSHYYIEDETIPFYEMVIRGIKPYTIEAFNFSADQNIQTLKAIETGANPHYKWIAQDTSVLKETKYEDLYSADYTAWMSSTKKDYQVFQDLYNKIKNSTITKHQKLAEGVFESSFENGVNVIVNYSKVEYWAGTTMIAPGKYVIMEGGK